MSDLCVESIEALGREAAEEWFASHEQSPKTEDRKRLLSLMVGNIIARHVVPRAQVEAEALEGAADRLPTKRGGGPVPKPPPDQEFYADWLRRRARALRSEAASGEKA